MGNRVVLTYEPVAFDRLAEEIRGIQRELAAVVEEAESDDGLVFVKVDARGDVVELDLDPRIYRTHDSAALARTIAETCRAARAKADARPFELTRSQLSLPH
ncbi:YbaB/EbfC family nucleoid-associated protein [Amycolatopsis carbonis]|uniref:YbaB/EbfC family nucleoid-associated protein n=1 Tax=Amycolatopsis carbonis TaxID=715471 RepID=A0A9Y2IF89_9PSEU|nr:YbaB/EbfC family nucleoid-associated protein [Amycolatopsis sp. 2-15]WIX77463.1 YbaB/EbfC family nucleoid-associated protein [Amycolatopsis sp. 2-15]